MVHVLRLHAIWKVVNVVKQERRGLRTSSHSFTKQLILFWSPRSSFSIEHSREWVGQEGGRLGE
ncbi:myb transcription [Moniliophthora roreri]|nr:myb transcription [Moniliophthora roreri]